MVVQPLRRAAAPIVVSIFGFSTTYSLNKRQTLFSFNTLPTATPFCFHIPVCIPTSPDQLLSKPPCGQRFSHPPVSSGVFLPFSRAVKDHSLFPPLHLTALKRTRVVSHRSYTRQYLFSKVPTFPHAVFALSRIQVHATSLQPRVTQEC